MDESDYYYRDIIEGASDADSVDSSDDDTDYRRLFDQGKHLSRADLEVLRAADVGSEGRWRIDGGGAEDEDSNLSFEREMENEARNHVNGVHVNAPPPPTFPAGRQVQSSSAGLGFPSASTAVAHSLASGSSVAAAAAAAALTTSPPVASTSRTREQENDELLYDPEEDDRDQRWADAHRALHSVPPPPPPPPPPGNPSSSSAVPAGPQQPGKKAAASSGLKASHATTSSSDATLNCPCCLTLLCLDCQRHQLYRTQYRAMFVLNCRVDYGRQLLHRDKEQLRAPFRRSKKNKKRLKTEDREKEGEEEETKPEEPGKPQPSLSEDQEQTSTSSSSATPAASSDLYHPVHCTACNTQVALYDTNEVYHFFSVLASH